MDETDERNETKNKARDGTERNGTERNAQRNEDHDEKRNDGGTKTETTGLSETPNKKGKRYMKWQGI